MFKKIVSNLSFSPGAASQLTFYMRRLKKEDLTRKFSAVAGAFALIFQLAAIGAPATSANASSENDIIKGGIKNKQELLEIYDKNSDGSHGGFQKLFSHFGISRANLANTTLSTITVQPSDNSYRSLGRKTYFNSDKLVEVGSQRYFLRLLSTWDTNGVADTYQVLQGKRADGSWFAVMLDCGNIVIKEQVHVVQNLKCVNLKADKLKGQAPLKVTFTAKAEAKNQKITKYIFKFSDGKVKESKDKTAFYQFDKPGTYKATVQIEGSTGDKTQVQPQCSLQITVKEKPEGPTPVIACLDLSADTAGGAIPLEVNFTTKAEARDQDIAGYRYDFGDGSSSEGSDKISHTYTKTGDFVAKVSVKGSKDTEYISSEDCQVTISPSVEVTPETPGDIELSKSALYTARPAVSGQLPNAHQTVALSGEVIQYTLATKNTGGSTVKDYQVKENILDVLEYADLVDAPGATFSAGWLNWPAQDIAAGQTLLKSFTVKVKSPIPSTPKSSSDPFGFDLRMDNSYGNTVSVNLEIPPEKQIEVASSTLPQTGAGENLAIMLGFVSMVVFFYLRNRQMVAELAVLKGDHTGHRHKGRR